MYQHKLAAAIQVSGKNLREFDDTVYLPFGSEYSIYLKNLNTVRASVSVEIDGESVADGGRFIIGPNQLLDVERFIKQGNLHRGNRFKFIRRSKAVEKGRGIRAEDGLVRIEFQFEHLQAVHYHSNDWGGVGATGSAGLSGPGGPYGHGVRGIGSNTVGSYDPLSATEDFYFASTGKGTVLNNVGITAPGSVSDQQFITVSSFPLDPMRHAIIFRLLGKADGGRRVTQSYTTKTRATCITCRTKNASGARFCTTCGTSLQII